jgi:hypothetical protein
LDISTALEALDATAGRVATVLVFLVSVTVLAELADEAGGTGR